MIKTINLTAGVEMAVELAGGVHARFENMGDETVYVSKTANVVAGGDGVIAVSPGATKYMKNVAAYGEYDGECGYQGTVYVKADTSCSVEIETGDYFFKSVNSGKGGAVTGKFVKIKGRVDTVDDLPLIADEGDLYFVGADSDEDSDEYVYTADGKWELIGNTEVDLSGYVKTSDMADVYGVETNTVPTIESKANENAVTLGYSISEEPPKGSVDERLNNINSNVDLLNKMISAGGEVTPNASAWVRLFEYNSNTLFFPNPMLATFTILLRGSTKNEMHRITLNSMQRIPSFVDENSYSLGLRILKIRLVYINNQKCYIYIYYGAPSYGPCRGYVTNGISAPIDSYWKAIENPYIVNETVVGEDVLAAYEFSPDKSIESRIAALEAAILQ